MEPQIDRYYSSKEVAQLLNLSLITVKRFIKKEKLPSHKKGSRRKINKTDLDLYLLEKIYKNLEQKTSVKRNKKIKKLVNFKKNLNLPIHRWFYFKEGYSEELVNYLIKRFEVKKGLVLDPFLGSGTTAVAALKNNLSFLGFEINPFLVFLAKSKLTVKLSKNLDTHIKNINNLRIIRSQKLTRTFLEKAFNKDLPKILSTKNYIEHIKNKKEKELLKIIFLCSLSSKENFLRIFNKKFLEVAQDIKNKKPSSKKAQIINFDSRDLTPFYKKYAEKVSLAIFSPPYLNSFDYTETYKKELWLGDFVKNSKDIKNLKQSSLSSHLNKTYPKDTQNLNKSVLLLIELLKERNLWNKKIPLMVDGYFTEMSQVLKSMHRFLKKGSKCCIVIGNSAYGNVVIPTDLLLADIAREAGFTRVETEVARDLGTSSQQSKLVNRKDLLRESLIILTK